MTYGPTGALDHVLIGASTLDAGVAWLRERTGVQASPGGVHPGLGTWNALASVGPNQYLEVIAPDPNQEGVETFYVPGLRAFETPHVATWASTAPARLWESDDLGGGLLVTERREGSRVRADGRRLSWRLAFVRHEVHGTFDGALPFLIDWHAQSPHPGTSAAPGLTLSSFEVHHPHADALRRCLQSMEVEVAVSQHPKPGFEVVVRGPRGRVSL